MQLLQGIWKMNINGKEGELNITGISEGIIAGTVMTNNFTGLWNESAMSIVFISTQAGTNGVATFSGNLFSTPTVPQVGTDKQWTLCGHVIIPQGNSSFVNILSNPRRSTFGWFAQKTEVV